MSKANPVNSLPFGIRVWFDSEAVWEVIVLKSGGKFRGGIDNMVPHWPRICPSASPFVTMLLAFESPLRGAIGTWSSHTTQGTVRCDRVLLFLFYAWVSECLKTARKIKRKAKQNIRRTSDTENSGLSNTSQTVVILTNVTRFSWVGFHGKQGGPPVPTFLAIQNQRPHLLDGRTASWKVVTHHTHAVPADRPIREPAFPSKDHAPPLVLALPPVIPHAGKILGWRRICRRKF